MKTRIVSLLTILCITLSSMAFGQDNVIKRNSCTFFGCSTLAVNLTLSQSRGGVPQTKIIDCPDAGESYLTENIKIKVTVSGKSSTGNYYLPTTTGGSTIIPATDLDFPTYGYSAGITKTADKQFTLTLTRFEKVTP